MFNYKAVLCAISSILIASSPAKADWQFTKWGMSPDQVQKASPVKLSSGDYCPVNNKNNSSGYYQVKYATDWNVGSMKFIACFLFADNKLRIVNLFSKNVNQDVLIRGLSQKYGQPKIDKFYTSTNYKWNIPNEQVRFTYSFFEGVVNPYVLSYEDKSDSDDTAIRNNL